MSRHVLEVFSCVSCLAASAGRRAVMNCVLNGMKKMMSCSSCKSFMAPGPDFWEKPRSLTWWKAGSHAEVRCFKWKSDKNCLQTMIHSCMCWTCFSFGIRCWNMPSLSIDSSHASQQHHIQIHPVSQIYFSYHVCACIRLCAFEDTPVVAPLISMDVELEAMVAFKEWVRGENRRRKEIWNESGLQMNFKSP